MIKTNNNELNK